MALFALLICRATFYGLMSSNHPELMASYPNPMLDAMPSARKYAAKKGMEVVGRNCSGLHYAHTLGPWGYDMSTLGPTKGDFGLDSNGPFSNLPIIWAWEYGDRSNRTEIAERWWPLIKGEAEFWSCFLSPIPNATQDDGYLHILDDCTNENWHTESCPKMRDPVLTLSLMRRTLGVVAEMAEFVGETPNPKWADTFSKIVPTPTGWFHVDKPTPGMGNTTHECSFCAWQPGDKSRTPTAGDCMLPSNGNGMMNGAYCNHSVDGRCPAGMGPCAQQVRNRSLLAIYIQK
jgi:hypothetical protein